MAKKARDAFRTISEVANWLDVPAHVLRFWESKFTQIKPVKRAGGRRYYRPADMRLIGGIKMLLHDDGLTIREEGAARRTARRARRKARIDERTTSDDTVAPIHGVASPPPLEDAPEAPFLHVEEEDAHIEDNVVSFHMQPAESAEPELDATAVQGACATDDADDIAEDVPSTPGDTTTNLEHTAEDTDLPDVPADPPLDGGSPTAKQQKAIALLKRLRGLEVSTHLVDGSETTLGALHTRLITLRGRMSAETTTR